MEEKCMFAFNMDAAPVWISFSYIFIALQVRASCADWPQTHRREPVLTDQLAGKSWQNYVI